MTTPSERLMPISDELRKAADIEAETPITVGAAKSAALTESEIEEFRELASKDDLPQRILASIEQDHDDREFTVRVGDLRMTMEKCIAARNIADRLVSELERKTEAVVKLQAFKDWVHTYLDQHGVPHHPPGTHGAEGCRIGDRMDWLMAQLTAAKARIDELEDELKYAQQIVTDTEKDRDSVHTKLTAANERIEELVTENERLKQWHAAGRSNVEFLSGGVRICLGNHCRSDDCDWEEYIPVDERDQLRQQLADREARITELETKIKRWQDALIESALVYGCGMEKV